MSRPREFDDLAAVRAARLVFWEQGYADTSLAQLQEGTGLSRSSLYAAYGSKRGLFERAALSCLDEVIDPLLAPMEAAGANADDVAAYFEAVAAFVRGSTSPAGGRGCLMINTAMELEGLDDEAREMVRNYRLRIRSAIRAALLSDDDIEDVDTRADLLTAAQTGVMTTARFDHEAAARTAELLASSVSRSRTP